MDLMSPNSNPASTLTVLGRLSNQRSNLEAKFASLWPDLIMRSQSFIKFAAAFGFGFITRWRARWGICGQLLLTNSTIPITWVITLGILTIVPPITSAVVVTVSAFAGRLSFGAITALARRR